MLEIGDVVRTLVEYKEQDMGVDIPAGATGTVVEVTHQSTAGHGTSFAIVDFLTGKQGEWFVYLADLEKIG